MIFNKTKIALKNLLLALVISLFCITGPIRGLMGEGPEVNETLDTDKENDDQGGLVRKNENSITINFSGDENALVFKRLPKSENITELASAGATDTSEERPAYELPSVFLAETELTIKQLRDLLSSESWNKFKSRVKSYMGGPDDRKFGAYVRAVDTSNDDVADEQHCPVVLVGLSTILEACNRLNEAMEEAASVDSIFDQIVEPTVRLPSTKEWQYAARFTVDLDTARKRKIFPEWIDLVESENVRLKGQWADICDAHGIPFTASPTAQEVCVAADRIFAKAKNKDGYELLGDIIKECMGTKVHITHNDSQCILPTNGESENPWGFSGLFGNASEWTIDGQTITEIDDFWGRLSSGRIDSDAASQEKFRIMGGQFLNTYAKIGAWKRWSIANGQGPITLDVLQAESNDSDSHEVFVDLKAGVRLCIHNKLKKDWFVYYRQHFLAEDSLEESNKEFSEAFVELCTKPEQSALADVLKTYSLLKSTKDSYDNFDTVCQVTLSLIEGYESLLSTTGAGRAKLREKRVDAAGGGLGSLDLGSFSSKKKKPKEGLSNSKQIIEPTKSPGSPAINVNFFEIMKEVNSS